MATSHVLDNISTRQTHDYRTYLLITSSTWSIYKCLKQQTAVTSQHECVVQRHCCFPPWSGWSGSPASVWHCWFSPSFQQTETELKTETVVHITSSLQPSHSQFLLITVILFTLKQGGHKVGEKKFPEFSTAIKLLFHRLSQQKVNVIMTFIKGHSISTPAV